MPLDSDAFLFDRTASAPHFLSMRSSGTGHKSFCLRRILAPVLTLLIAISVCVAEAVAAPAAFSLTDAREQGSLVSGSAKGTATPTFDESVKKDVLEFDYTLAKGAEIRVWAKGFPAGLGAVSVDVAKIGFKVMSAEQVNQVSVKLQIKGAKATQTVPLQLKTGWNFVQEAIDWDTVGDLNEIAFVAAQIGEVEPVKGTLLLTLEFMKRAPAKSAAAPAQAVAKQIPDAKAAVVKSPVPAAPALNAPAAVAAAPKAPSSPVPAARTSFSLADARDQGTSATGAAKGTVTPTFDEGVGKDVLEVDYAMAQGESVRVWTKSFPAELGPSVVNAAKIGIRVLDAGQANQVTMKLEIKGAKDIQIVPVRLKSGWNSAQELIDWEKIGGLDEIAFVVSPQDGAGPVKGTLSLGLDFIKRSAFQKTNALAETFSSSFSLLDAGAKGVFNIGPAKGLVFPAFDEAIQKDVWQFDYSIPRAAVIGVWTQNFPAELGARAVDAVRIGIKVPDPKQVDRISVKLEIKGALGMQSVPLQLKPGWNSFRELINWNSIGELREVVFVVSPTEISPMGNSFVGGDSGEVSQPADVKPVTGTLFFDLDFGKISFLQKHMIVIKTGIIFLIGVLLSLMTLLLGRAGVIKRAVSILKPAGEEGAPQSAGRASPLARLKMDFFYGMMAVLIAGVAIRIYSLGSVSPLDAGFSLDFLALGIMGAVIAWLFKFKLTGKPLTASEVFLNTFLTGLLAVGSSRQDLLQSPATWGQILTVTNLTATLAFVIYHVINALAMASSGKHLKTINAVLIVGTPFLFGWLLLLENVTLVQKLSNGLTAGLLAAWPAVLEILGRFLVIFVFNEAVTNGISLTTKGKALKTGKAHLLIALVSLGVIVSPLIADLGAKEAVAAWPMALRALVAILTSMFSYAGLWGEVYLITGMLLDWGHRTTPSWETLSKHVNAGVRKGMAYVGILMAILYALHMFLGSPVSQKVMTAAPILLGVFAGALIFPLLKTIIETFDGSLPFFERTRYSYRNATLYVRGAVVGFGFAYMITQGMFQKEMGDRIPFGLFVGLLASGGVSILRDVVYAFRRQGKVQSWRLYLIDSLLGAFVGSAVAFYLDSLQIPVILAKFQFYGRSILTGQELHQFNASTFTPEGSYMTWPFLNKWGQMNLGICTGNAKLLFLESLAGVINWSVAAWLFAINKVFMQAFFDKDKTPIKFFFSKEGFATLIEHMIYVLRWGLWMSPIIFTFLRMMPEPTWYNQDGAVRTFFAIYHNLTMSPDAFQAWSLQIFVYVMAFDFFRILIWMDHMGLRVATLVNLSFLGMDKLDEKISRFIGPAAAQRYIPEGVKRFTTWGPLLIPFYLPGGPAWDYAWNTSEAIQNAGRGKGIISTLQSLSLTETLLVIAAGILACTAVSFVIRSLADRARQRRIEGYELGNREYRVVLKENGEIFSEVFHHKSDVYPKEYDISRRSYDLMDPCGRILYLVDAAQGAGGPSRYWPVVGNFPQEKFQPSRVQKDEDSLKIVNASHGIRTTVTITLPDQDTPAELWDITVENLTDKPRQLKLVPYLEWVLNGGLHDRFHTQYARLYPEMEYVSKANAVLSWQKSTKSMGILATDAAPEGFQTSRVDFIGRVRSIWSPRILETLDFLSARDTASYPTFDPIGSLVVNAAVGPNASASTRLMIGYAKNRNAALELVAKHLKPRPAKTAPPPEKKRALLIGHGEIPAGTPQPYSEPIDNGNKLLVRTPYTPRPIDHALSNAVHSVMVTNRGLHTSCNGNSQQNRLTPDWPDTVTKEIPTEAIYLYDPDKGEWYSPTYLPLADTRAKYESEFGVDGTAVFRMTNGTVSTELTVFVPPDDPAGVYLLTVKNNSAQSRRMRVAPYFHMVLAFQPEKSGPLHGRYDKALNALIFENPRNIFRTGPAFVSLSIPAECTETKRGRFFGTGRTVAHPYLVEKGRPDASQLTDDGQIAGFLGTLEIPAHGECTVAVILGQTDCWKDAVPIIQKYKDIETVQKSLEQTRNWWTALMGTVEVQTNQPEFDRFQNWLKYQALAERIWPRRGFYQTSGAFGFRDQLQDTVNLIWVDPALARKQIILHASHQFLEGDVFHWFFTLTDGRTAFSCRSHASDNPLWLAWGVVEYVRATGDDSILDEMASYVVSEFPFAPLPKNKQGWGHLYHRTTRADSIYRHCLRSIDLVLEDRMGKNGLPLIQTGDWNDGLDEIGSEGKGESVWLGFFLHYILKDMVDLIEWKDGGKRKEHYLNKMKDLEAALERTWRDDRYLRAFHDDGTEIGIKDSGIWEIDALTAAWAVMSGINPKRGLTVFNTALTILEKEDTILLGWPALREDTKPYLGRSSKYPEGVRENGMYCHGVQWLVRAARILAEQFEKQGDRARADEYRKTAYRLWLKISPISHVMPQKIEIYGGQPNKQAADLLTTFDQGRMIWHGYTGAAGWMLRQALEGVLGVSLIKNEVVLPADLDKTRGELKVNRVRRDVSKSPLKSVL